MKKREFDILSRKASVNGGHIFLCPSCLLTSSFSLDLKSLFVELDGCIISCFDHKSF